MEKNDKVILDQSVLLASSQTADNNLGITQEYTGNRAKLWDSTKSKQAYKNKMFGDKQTIIDESSGKVLHKSHTAAKKKYHQKDKNGNIISTKWAEHAAEVDHKVSLASLHEEVKYNPFLSDSDLKEIANDEINYRIISKKENTSKGADNSTDIGTHLVLQGKFASRTIKNAGGEFVNGAVDTVKGSAFKIIAEGVEKILIENKDLEETLQESTKAVINAAVVGGTEKLLINTATQIFSNSGNQILKNIVEQNAVGQVLVMGAAIGKSLVKYIDGDIDAKELADEIALNGSIIMISTVISTVIPVPFVAPIISFIATNVATMFYETNKHMDDYLIKEKQIKSIEREALQEIDKKRTKFNDIVSQEFEYWDNTVIDGFYQLLNSSLEQRLSVDGMVAGLDKILSLCGEQAFFHSVEEYENQLDKPLTLCF